MVANTMTLLKMTDVCIRAKDNGKVDFTKAIDTINYELLISYNS